MKRKLIVLALVLAAVFLLAVGAFAAPAALLQDEVGALSGEEAAALNRTLEEVSDRTGLDIVAVLTSDPGVQTAEAYADDFFDYNGYGQGASRDGILFLICTESRDWAFSTRGYGITAFKDAGLDELAARLLPDLRDGAYADAIRTYAAAAEDYIRAARSGKPYEPKTPFPFVIALVGSLLAAFVVALIVSLILRGRLKSVRRQDAATDYVTPGSMHLTTTRDTFLYHTVDRTRRQQSSSSGCSSTHISSSGATHGGRSGKF